MIYSDLANALKAQNIASFALDMRGHYQSTNKLNGKRTYWQNYTEKTFSKYASTWCIIFFIIEMLPFCRWLVLLFYIRNQSLFFCALGRVPDWGGLAARILFSFCSSKTPHLLYTNRSCLAAAIIRAHSILFLCRRQPNSYTLLMSPFA